jgi:heme-degrading monooxygenase HmoA
VFPTDGRKGDYLKSAARLKSELERVDGSISVERFQSLMNPDKLLSLSFWRDEEAVVRWRSHVSHRPAVSRPEGGFPRLPSAESPSPASLEGVMMLEKPVREQQILEHLRPIARTRQR